LFHLRLPGTAVPGFDIPPLLRLVADLSHRARSTLSFVTTSNREAWGNPVLIVLAKREAGLSPN